MKRALVTGGAGLIGSHITDRLVGEGWQVRVVDALEPVTHPHGAPAWLNAGAEFVHGDVRDAAMWRAALDGIDVVFHQAAYGGYMPEIAKYVDVNSRGTAIMLETIRDGRFPVEKVVVASSQAAYAEGAGRCPTHGRIYPPVRSVADLAAGEFEVRCPHGDGLLSAVATPEEAPLSGESVYALTKVDQERLTLMWSRQTGIPAVALRYACTYGPRQSIYNPYTGVIAIFCTRLLNGLPPLLYEDGAQSRDFVFVGDVAAANLQAATTNALDGRAINVGSSGAATIRDLARTLGALLGRDIEPVLANAYRPGEIRHLISDTSRLRATGWSPQTSLVAGLRAYLDWIAQCGNVGEYFTQADRVLRGTGAVRTLAGAGRVA